ncbi:MAG: DUF4115 domain-containing protein [Candidatus Omnitrophica bacterium]|nr:DUF4115 domain-containing protein [Candidatus Omnitrophota bacterium]
MQATTNEPGSLLKSTREARGITLQTVHEATKIPMDVLRAIEEGYTVRTLSPFYLRGFLKMYAGYLHINVRDVAVEYKKPEPVRTASSPPSVPKEEFDLMGTMAKVFTPKRKQQIAAVVGVFVVLFFLFKIITFFTHRRPGPVQTAKTTIRKEAALPPAAGRKSLSQGSSRPSGGESQPAKNNRPAEPVPVKKAQPANPPVEEPVSKAPSKPAYAAAQPAVSAPREVQKDIILTVRAKKDSWLRVAADGIVVFQSSLAYGKSESWIASEKIEISGKNMQQLEFELNGKLLGALSRRDRNATKVVITRDGLSVIQ